MAHFDVFYMKPDFFGDGIMGYDWCKRKGLLPKPTALGDTHAYVKMIEASSLDDVFKNMQGEVWSPNGEAREQIRKLGLKHTSMSVGDVIVSEDGTACMVDRWGFHKLD